MNIYNGIKNIAFLLMAVQAVPNVSSGAILPDCATTFQASSEGPQSKGQMTWAEARPFVSDETLAAMGKYPDLNLSQITKQAFELPSNSYNFLRQYIEYRELKRLLRLGMLTDEGKFQRLVAIEINNSDFIKKMEKEDEILIGQIKTLGASTLPADQQRALDLIKNNTQINSIQVLHTLMTEGATVLVRSQARWNLIRFGEQITYNNQNFNDLKENLKSATAENGYTAELKVMELAALSEDLLVRLLQDPSSNIQAAAAVGLSYGRTESFLLDFLNHENENVRQSAGKALENLHEKGRTVDVLAQALKSPDPTLRLQAATELSGRSDPSSFELKRQALTDPVIEVRLEAVNSLKDDPTPQARIALRQAAVDSFERVRNFAEEILLSNENEQGGTWNEAKNTFTLEVERRKNITDQERRIEDHIMAFEAAANVYNVPELPMTKSSSELAAMREKFLGGVPLCYRATVMVTDPATGLKLALYEPRPPLDADHQIILSIGGTQFTSDALSDLNLGFAQKRSPALNSLIQNLKNQALGDSTHPPKNIIVTGHSLGGGLAQAIGYDIQKEMDLATHASSQKPGVISVVTWNGFGGKELIQKSAIFSAKTADELDAVNYRLPNDPVSHIGTHIGPVFNLPWVTSNPISAHLGESLRYSIIALQGLNHTEQVAVWQAPLVTQVTSALGWISDKITYNRYASTRFQAVQMLGKARLEWIKNGGFRELYPGDDWLTAELTRIEKDALDTGDSKSRDLISSFEKQAKELLNSLQIP